MRFLSQFGLAVALVSAVLAPRPARAEVIAVHDGCTDPTTEGWTLQPTTKLRPVASPLCDDGGVAAWCVDDNVVDGDSPFGVENLDYLAFLTDAQVARAQSLGFHVSASVKVVPSGYPEGINASVNVDLLVGNVNFRMNFGIEAGQQVVQIYHDDQGGGPKFARSVGYHLYEFRSAGGLIADFYIDGALVHSGLPGFANSPPNTFAFGARQTGTKGKGCYALVELEIPDDAVDPVTLASQLATALEALPDALWTHVGYQRGVTQQVGNLPGMIADGRTQAALAMLRQFLLRTDGEGGDVLVPSPETDALRSDAMELIAILEAL